jgi:hypothetical protein
MAKKIIRLLLLAVMVLSFIVVSESVFAQMSGSMGDMGSMDGMDHMDGGCMTDPLGHLPTCVTHHYDRGDFDNKGIYRSLFAKAENAVKQYNKGNAKAATNLLNSFINELQAQNGKHVTEMAAKMLIHHAQMAIDQIN